MPIDHLDALNLRDLRAILALSEELHFGRASERLGISQPSLSASIAKTEAILGRTLFHRTSRKVALAPRAGEVVESVRRAMSTLESVNAIDGVEREITGRFHLGIIPTLAPYYLPDILPILRGRFPSLELILYEATTERVLRLLRRGEIDAAIIALPTEVGDLHVEPLFREELVLAAPEEEPWTDRRLADVSELDADQMLFMEDGHCLRDHTLQLCREGGKSVRLLHVASLESLFLMVSLGMGASVVPALAASKKKSVPGVVMLPFDDPPPSRQIAMITRSAQFASLVDVLHESAPAARQWRR